MKFEQNLTLGTSRANQSCAAATASTTASTTAHGVAGHTSRCLVEPTTTRPSSLTASANGEKNGMPHSSKPIVCICGSDNIDYIDLDKYIDPTHVGEVISGESLGIDNIARDWAFKNKIEYVEFKPNFDI